MSILGHDLEQYLAKLEGQLQKDGELGIVAFVEAKLDWLFGSYNYGPKKIKHVLRRRDLW